MSGRERACGQSPAKNKQVNDVNSDISERIRRIRSHLKVMGSTDCRRAPLQAKGYLAQKKNKPPCINISHPIQVPASRQTLALLWLISPKYPTYSFNSTFRWSKTEGTRNLINICSPLLDFKQYILLSFPFLLNVHLAVRTGVKVVV